MLLSTDNVRKYLKFLNVGLSLYRKTCTIVGGYYNRTWVTFLAFIIRGVYSVSGAQTGSAVLKTWTVHHSDFQFFSF